MSKFANLVVFIDGTGNNDFKKSVDEQIIKWLNLVVQKQY